MEVLLEPYNYLLSNPGKEIRTTLILAFEEWVPLAPSKREEIIEIIKMLHSASLMIDDVEDNSSLRRSKPVAHKIYGIPATINCANYVYFLALEKLTQIADLEAINVFTQELIQLHRGQGMEIYWRDSVKCPTEEEYIQMVQNSNF
jgi:geranylgeranyl diphosphate synthase type 3